MPSLPPDAPPPSPTAQAAGPDQAVMWIYVDAQRTHELHVGLRRGPTLQFLVRERAAGMEEAWETLVPLAEPWESRVHHAQLEERLTLLGTYYRHSVGTPGSWSPVRRPSIDRALDLAPLSYEGIRGDAQFHYYGSRRDETGVLLIVVPDPKRAGRSLLARLDFTFPGASTGRLALVHASLPSVLLRSALAAAHVEVRARGLEKLAGVDRAVGANRAWAQQLDQVLGTALARIASGAWGGQLPTLRAAALEAARSTLSAPPPTRTVVAPRPISPVSPVPASPRVATRTAAPTRSRSEGGWSMPERLLSDDNPYVIEYEEPEPPDRSPTTPVAKIEENTLDFRGALTHPRILALHERFLVPGEDVALFAQGELALRAAMKAKRAAARREEQHLLSILEASLLIRYALRPGGDRNVDPHAADLLKRALVYL